MTIHLPADLASELEKLALATGGNTRLIAVAALRAFVESEALQIRDVQESIAEADRGEFASADEVDSFFAKYDS
ncbi:CopG family ribbon-helix-helix protein [Massilia glaciei]|nr:hypothetical protein [Massilia glaciei]